ncbi:hypothetical protein GF360_03990 [candidate division WWE3 bacterium]|nr:hypothetical protein [candidate division WWE3 bacterium]
MSLGNVEGQTSRREQLLKAVEALGGGLERTTEEVLERERGEFSEMDQEIKNLLEGVSEGVSSEGTEAVLEEMQN